MTSLNKIQVRNLNKTFNQNHVLKGINFDLKNGESLVIIGGSGTGKSVLIKCIIGLIKADLESQILIENVDVTQDTLEAKQKRNQISMVFQGSALFDSLSVWENIAFKSLQNKQIDRTHAYNLAVERLAAVGLKSTVAELYPIELSGGMQRRVALARAVASTPDILFCDEPTAGLDPIFSGVISGLIRQHVKELGCTTITITHDMACARTIADRIAMLHQGQIIWMGTPDELDHTTDTRVQQFVHGRSEGPIQLI